MRLDGARLPAGPGRPGWGARGKDLPPAKLLQPRSTARGATGQQKRCLLFGRCRRSTRGARARTPRSWPGAAPGSSRDETLGGLVPSRTDTSPSTGGPRLRRLGSKARIPRPGAPREARPGFAKRGSQNPAVSGRTAGFGGGILPRSGQITRQPIPYVRPRSEAGRFEGAARSSPCPLPRATTQRLVRAVLRPGRCC